MTGRSPLTPVVVRTATEGDADGVLAIARELVADGTTYVFAPETTDDELRAYWLDPRHVANASYAVAQRFAGGGVGRAMGEHSLEEARRLGFKAMQFNFVVSTNEAEVALWKNLGFRIVGELPKAFRHPARGLVDAYVMHRFL